MLTREVRQSFRLYPTTSQERLLAELFGASRVVYNTYVYSKDQAWQTQSDQKPLDLANKTTAALAGYEWMNEYSIAILQQARRDAEAAYRNYFSSIRKQRNGPPVGRPNYRKRNSRQSIRWSGVGSIKIQKLNRRWMSVRLPQPAGRKPEWLRFRSSQELYSTPTSVTIIRNSDWTYTVSFVTRQEIAPTRSEGAVAGADLGLKDLVAYVDSNGERYKIPAPKHYRSAERKLARAQRLMARKQRGSRNSEKARLELARAHAKVARSRQDHARKTALQLVNENQVIGLETLAVKNLLSNRTLTKSISDAGWSQLVNTVESTAERVGCRTVRADRFFPSTRLSSCCGMLSGKKGLSVREWRCDCGLNLDRDYNAAVNLMVAAGHAETLNDCGVDVRRGLARAVDSEAVTPLAKF